MIFTVLYFLAVFEIGEKTYCAIIGEKECSKFDYEYRVLERIIFLENRNTELEKKQIVLERKNEDLVELLKEQRLEMERRDEELETKLNQTGIDTSASISRIFFTARPTTPKSYGKNQIIAFDTIISKEGGGYDSATGIFTAPRNGVYLFSLAIKANRNWEYVDLFKNGNPIGHMKPDGRGSGDDDSLMETAAFTLVVKLVKEDRVYAKSRGDGGSELGAFSFFTGVLIR